jgi:hypothetical protein
MGRVGALLIAGIFFLGAFGPGLPTAQAQTSPEIILAQGQGQNFFEFLFGNRRQARPAPPPPIFQIIPQAPERKKVARPRREKRVRPAAPQPREVAAVEKAPDAKRVLVAGDFFAGALAKGLADAHSKNPNVIVIDATSGSSGLVRSDYFDWPGKIAGIVEEQKADAVLVMVGGNDRQTIKTEAGSFNLGSDGWRAAYASRVSALADAVKAAGKPMLWLGLVPVSSSAMSRDYSAINGIVREQLESKGIRFIETWNGFANEEGKYVAVGPDVSGQSVQLRASDGLNFTRAGQRKLAYYVEQELNEVLGGTSPLLAAVDPTAGGVVQPGESPPLVGPMVPLDALRSAGGEALSGSAAANDKRGAIVEDISARLVGEERTTPPRGRTDFYMWPPPPPPEPAAAQEYNPDTPGRH